MDTPRRSKGSDLLRIKRDRKNPGALDSWNTSVGPHCTWNGIACVDGSVVEITLSDVDIVPPGFYQLHNLAKLNLSNNFLPGTFPNSLLNCTNLQSLDLSQNYFVGIVPSDIDRLSSLRYLSLSETISPLPRHRPIQFRRRRSCRHISTPQPRVHLFLHLNLFNGTFPSEVGDLSNFEILELAYSPFSPARIPSDFGRLKKLKYLGMTGMYLIGEIPDTFSNLTDLEQLNLDSSMLTGRIPPGLFVLKNLTILSLQFNRLSGEIL